MARFFDRFLLPWGTTTGGLEDPGDANAGAGFEYLGATTPSKQLFNWINQISDQKLMWLFNQLAGAAAAKGITLTATDTTALTTMLGNAVQNSAKTNGGVTDLDISSVDSASLTYLDGKGTWRTAQPAGDYLSTTATAAQSVTGPVTFKISPTLPAVTDSWNAATAVRASDVKTNFVKQGWGFSNFGNNSLYLGWRSDGTGIGLGVDGTDVGTLALIGSTTPRLGLADWTEQNYTLPAQGNRTVTLTFTAPYAGVVHVEASANFSGQNTNQTQLAVLVNGETLSADNVSNTTCMSNGSSVKVSAGTVTVSSFLSTSADNPPNVGHTLRYLFVPR